MADTALAQCDMVLAEAEDTINYCSSSSGSGPDRPELEGAGGRRVIVDCRAISVMRLKRPVDERTRM